jgi:hypothetical protein
VTIHNSVIATFDSVPNSPAKTAALYHSVNSLK